MANPTIDLTADVLRAVLSYDQGTGRFIRLVAMGGKEPGSVAGKVDNLGYTVIKIKRRTYKAHRLAWLYVYGEWPEGHLDHKDNNRSNNRIDNLRLASRSQNKANSKTYRNNTSGLKGAKPHPNGKWQARIGVNGKRLHLGYFKTACEAHEAYMRAATMHYGQFARSS